MCVCVWKERVWVIGIQPPTPEITQPRDSFIASTARPSLTTITQLNLHEFNLSLTIPTNPSNHIFTRANLST